MSKLNLALLIITLALGPRAWPAAGPKRADAFPAKGEHPTRVIAKYADGIPAQLLTRSLEQHAMKLHKQVPLVPGLVVLEGSPVEKAPAKGVPAQRNANDLHARIKGLRDSGLFEYVEPDYVVKASRLPNDSSFANGTLWGLRSLDAEHAWDITTGSTNVIVAIVDTGIRYTHQELAAQMWRNPAEIPGNGIDDDHDGYVDNVYGMNAITGSGNPFDDNDHGTHVSGTIGAAANDGHPHVGVAWQVRLMACKFLDADGSGYTSDAIECINFAVSKGAKILNNSWGGGGYSQALYDAIAAARNAGVLFVAAAGNSGGDADRFPMYPAAYDLENVVSVAAIDRYDDLASFSNVGRNSVDLAAPGVDIFSCTAGSDFEYQTFPGTSMATPHVSGVAALVAARFPGIGLVEMRQRLLTTTVPLPSLEGHCASGGRVNAYNALTATVDGTLELRIWTSDPERIVPGSNVVIYVAVTDLIPVINGLVGGQILGGPQITFSNNGQFPDVVAADHIYSGIFSVPTTGTNLTVTVAATAPDKQVATRTVAFPIHVPPPNDQFADRIPCPAASTTVHGSNIDASKELGEPNHGGNPGGKSVWWLWTAPNDEPVTITTVGSSFDTLLGVYSGNSVKGLSLIARNDDHNGLTSAVLVLPSAGQAYAIAVDGYGGTSGAIQLNIIPGNLLAPTNDLFANPIRVANSSATVYGTSQYATKEPGEPNHAGNAGGKSVWWTWTARVTGTARVDTMGSSFDTLLGIYTGNSTGLSLVASNDDATNDLTSAVTFTAVAGTIYQIAVDGYRPESSEAASGGIRLNVRGPIPPPPPNDLFANFITIGYQSNSVVGNNEGATKDSGEPNHGSNSGGKSVWWRWTAPVSGWMRITTDGSAFDTLLGVYTGSVVNGLTLVAGDDESGEGHNSAVTFAASAGTTYLIAVDGYYGDSGDILLNIYPLAPLRLLPPQHLPDGTCRLWIASSEGRPLEPSRRDRIGVYASTNIAQPVATWTRLYGALTWSDGLFRLDEPAAPSHPHRFYITLENP